MLFSNWPRILKILVMAVTTYLAFWFLLRISGKRSFSKLNVNDTLVAVAIGPILASTITLDSMTLLDGVSAIGMLLLLQFVFNKLTAKFSTIEKIAKNNPSLLFYNGKFLQDQMMKDSITKKDIYKILRQEHYCSLDEVQAIIMESDGSFTVIGIDKRTFTLLSESATNKNNLDKFNN